MNIQFHFKKQVKYLFALLLFAFCFVSTKAQNHDWFKGSWYGAKNFPHAHIGIKALVRIEVDSMYNNYFSGRLIYMYPKDTIARLIRTFNGKINGNAVSINKGQELYLLDPRSRSFWNNCSQCNETGLFLLSDSDLVFKITTTGCGDSCDAETVFSRNITTYDSVAKVDIQKMFSPNKEPVATSGINSKQKNNKPIVAKQNLVDSGKNNKNATAISKNSSKTNSKKDSLTATANINSTQKNNKAIVVKQSLVDSNKNNTNAINKNLLNTNSKKDSLITTANINSKQKNSKTTAAKQILVDSGKNNTNATAISKNPSNTNSKKDSLIATANINSKQKNNKANVAKQNLVDSNKNNTNATAISKNPSNTNSKKDSLSATATINSTQKNNKANVVKQSPIDSGKNNTNSTAINKNPSSTNNTTAKTTADTTKNHQPLSDSDVNALQRIVPAKTFILADTSNQFISRADSVAMAKLHRETNLVNEYQVSDPHIQVELFDNGIIDSDAVTVYYNGRILFNNVVLSYKPIAFAIDASGANRHHEFVLIAENEGSIPPNTALLRITAGKQQFKLFVSTTLSKNAKIAIDYTGY